MREEANKDIQRIKQEFEAKSRELQKREDKQKAEIQRYAELHQEEKSALDAKLREIERRAKKSKKKLRKEAEKAREAIEEKLAAAEKAAETERAKRKMTIWGKLKKSVSLAKAADHTGQLFATE